MGLDALRPAGESFFHHPAHLGLLVMLGLACWWLGRRPRSAGWLPAALVVGAVLGGLGAWLAPSTGSRALLGLIFWELAIASLVAAGLAATPRAAQPPPPEFWGLLAVATAMRTVWLTSIPIRAHVEEIWVGLWCRFCVDGQTGLFGTGFFGNPLLHFCLDGILLKLLGDDLLALRLGSVLVGVVTVALVHRLTHELFGDRWAALIAGSFVATHHALIHYSRTGGHYVDAALAVTVTVYLLARARTSGWGPGLLAGLASGVMVQGYIATRAAVVLALLMLLGAMSRKRIASTVRTAAAFGLGLAATLGPQLVYYLQHPSALSERESDVLAFSPLGLLSGSSQDWSTLLANAKRAAVVFTIGTDPDSHYGPSLPFVVWLWVPLVIVGIAALFRLRDRRTGLVLSWLFVVIGLGAIATEDQIWRRTLATIPAIAIAAGAAVTWFAASSSTGRRWRATLLLLTIGGGLHQVHYNLWRHDDFRPIDLPTATARLVAESDDPVQLFTLPELGEESAHLELLAADRTFTVVSDPARLAPGPVVVSSIHAGMVPELLKLPGASVTAPFGALPTIGTTLPSVLENLKTPPVLVHLSRPIDRDRGYRISPGARWSPLGVFDYRRRDNPDLTRAIIATEVEMTRPGRVRIDARARRAGIATFLDARPVANHRELELPVGTHRVEATFEPRIAVDSFQLGVTVEAGAGVCCRPPAEGSAAQSR